MSETHVQETSSPANGRPRAAELAAHLAARLCHDLISPASAIVSGLDLLEDPGAQDMRQEAMDLISSSARKLSEVLEFCRVAFGASASAATFDSRELERLAQGVFGHIRADLEWKVEPASLSKSAARALLNMAQLGGAALPTGGVTRVRVAQEGAVIAIAIEAQGPRARLRPEVLAGLRGEGITEGLHGHWVQAYYLHELLGDAGGRIFADVDEEKVTFAATLPA